MLAYDQLKGSCSLTPMDCVQACIDRLSDLTGIKAIPSLLDVGIHDDDAVLDVPAYSQTDGYSCGATAGWAIVKTFRPRANFDRFYNLVRPEPGVGVGPRRVISALRKFGIGTRTCRALGWKDIKKCIDDGFPMLVGTGKEGPSVEGDHWSILYGYRPKPRSVFIGNDPGLFRSQLVVPWNEFSRSCWNPKGMAIVCWGT